MILDLSTEVLRDILSYTLPYEDECLRTTWRKNLFDSPFHCLRAVCRPFRLIVAQLPFWCEPDFPLAYFRPSRNDRVGFLQHILADPDIIKTLERKTEWRLTVDIIELMTDLLPSFYENAKSIHLQLEHSHPWEYIRSLPRPLFDTGMNILGHSLQNLTSFSVQYGTTPINLQVLTESLPSIERLTLKGSPKFIVGTLSLRYLREMEIEVVLPDQLSWRISHILPIAATATFQTLDIYGYTSPLTGIHQNKPLNPFVNLTTLRILPLDRHIAELVMEFPGRLRSFETLSFFTQDLDKSVLVFSAPCLQTLENLRFHLAESTDEIAEMAVNLITKITTLRKLDLSMKLDLQWYTYFSCLTSLECLEWTTFEFVDRTAESLGIVWQGGDVSTVARAKKAETVFTKAFDHCLAKPEMRFKVFEF